MASALASARPVSSESSSLFRFLVIGFAHVGPETARPICPGFPVWRMLGPIPAVASALAKVVQMLTVEVDDVAVEMAAVLVELVVELAAVASSPPPVLFGVELGEGLESIGAVVVIMVTAPCGDFCLSNNTCFVLGWKYTCFHM